MPNSKPEVEVLVGRQEVENTADAPVHVAVKVAGPPADPDTDRRPLKIIFAIDRSGSMAESASEDDAVSKMTRVKQIVHRLQPMLTEHDQVGFVAYADFVTDRFSPLPMAAKNRGLLESAVDVLQPGSNTNIGEALQVACEAAQALCSGDDDPVYVLFLTDGNPTVGIMETSTLVGLLQKPWAKGVRLLCAGVGRDYNPGLLQALAEESGGHFCHIESEGQFAAAMGDLLGAAASVQHTSIQVHVTPASGFVITQDFTPREVHEEPNGCHMAHLPDVYAESRNAVGFELKAGVRDPLPPDPVLVCTVEIKGVEVATGESWTVSEKVEATIKAPGTATAPYNSKAYAMLMRIVAQTAAKQALACAEAGAFGMAVGRIDQAIRFAEYCRPFCDVEEALQLLREIRETVSRPENFRQERHDRTATTMWFTGRGSAAPGGASQIQQRMTQVFSRKKIGDGKDPADS